MSPCTEYRVGSEYDGAEVLEQAGAASQAKSEVGFLSHAKETGWHVAK